MGFSTTRCFPAAATWMPTSACRPLGTHTDTTSMSSRLSRSPRLGSAAQPCSAAKAFARSGSTSVTATSRAPGTIAAA